MKKTPVNVFTGFLGSGKTTIIINLIKSLPKDYKAVVLKNEFGDIAVDSILAKESNIEITEMINGCLCCVLVGKLGDALNEILEKYKPDRIIVETSGSAYPGPIAWEIRKMGDRLDLDSIVTVIDAINFEGYKDKSYTAKLQAQFTDLILINKHELVDERDLDEVLDDVYELNPTTPKIKTDNGFIKPDVIFGIDTKLFSEVPELEIDRNHDHQDREVDLIHVYTDKNFTQEAFSMFLEKLPRMDFYRIKGVVKLEEEFYLLNYVFGRFNFIKLTSYEGQTKLIFMGKNFSYHTKTIKKGLNLQDLELKLHLAEK